MYSLDTSAFYTEEEQLIENNIFACRNLKKSLVEESELRNSYRKQLQETDYDKQQAAFKRELIKILNSRSIGLKYCNENLCEISYEVFNQYILLDKLTEENCNNYCIDEIFNYNDDWRDEIIAEEISLLKKEEKEQKFLLQQTLDRFDGVRKLNSAHIKPQNVISIFQSNLTRIQNIQTNELTENLMIVRTYYFKVLQDIILNGYTYNGEKYKCLTASAGQIRTKKAVFIKESVWNKHEKTLMCGLTIKKINSLGGINVNKFLAYLALCNSATDEWTNFNIDRSIVVDDMEVIVSGLVDYIDDVNYSITRKQMDMELNQTDGCGMMLPSVSKRNFMVRLPWIKGLLGTFDFVRFIKQQRRLTQNNNIGVIKDIYGTEHDVIAENINIIFTKSQFKLWKYYKDWNEYKAYFKQYDCSANTCNEEEGEFNFARLNYQMLQTLTDITDDELKKISERTRSKIKNIASSRETMLKAFGVTKFNKNKNYFQKCLEIYPELLQDDYTKNTLRDIKKSYEKEAWSARLDVDGKYTFVIPDLYAFCEYLFLGKTHPEGLLKDGEVFCRLFSDSPKLDCLRSPHLYREHAVRKNVVSVENKKWFKTNAIYISIYDLVCRILQCDYDGDKLLVVADKTLINVAERNMKDIVPLFYDMKKAEPNIINNNAVYNGMITAYTGGNIGVISNDITKIWNSNNPDLDVIKLLCAENNYIID